MRIEVGDSRGGVVEVAEENGIPKVVRVVVEGNRNGVVTRIEVLCVWTAGLPIFETTAMTCVSATRRFHGKYLILCNTIQTKMALLMTFA